jgi:uncharacterized membrane-anchored protein YitT (DUF2179 family)
MEQPMPGHERKPTPAVPRFKRRQQLLALVITHEPQIIADRVLKEMRRGATALQGHGMYTREARQVLMVALTVTELPQLKALITELDPNAFVVVSPAQEVLGRGFQPLTEDQPKSD